MADVYDRFQEEDKYQRKITYWFALFLKGIFYVVTMLLKLVLDIAKEVLHTFGILPGGSKY